MTRYHRKWDRRDRLLNAVQKLVAGILRASDRSVNDVFRPRSNEAERLYVRSKSMIARIKRELEHG